MTTCPKCGYVRQPGDDAPDYECPKCGVVYAKVQPQPVPRTPEVAPAEAAAGVAPTPARTYSTGQQLLGWVVIAAIAAVAWSACSRGGSASRAADKLAMDRCEQSIRADATFPSTVDIQWFQGVHAAPHDSGALLVSMDFTARNALGADMPYTARCLVNSDGDVVGYNVRTR